MSQRISNAVREFVRQRAQRRCEYCLRHEDDAAVRHQSDHIKSRKHGGENFPENLAWSCAVCNLLKGPETAAIDPLSGIAARFFNPRLDRWE